MSCNDKLLQKTTACLPSSAPWQPFFTSPTGDKALCAPCHLKSVCHCYFLPHSLPRRCSCYTSSGSHFLGVQVASQSCERCARFISSPLHLILDPIDVADHFNVNLCWWSFPYSSAVTWLCQSGCLASTRRRPAVPAPALLGMEIAVLLSIAKLFWS